jgi:MFS transporter, CP family, cyanate transporter
MNTPGSPAPVPRLALVTLTIMLAAVILRSPIVAVAPVTTEIADDLGVASSVIGLLTTIPVLCFALLTPLVVALVQRLGAEFALVLCLVGAAVGCAIRSSDGLAGALAGTAVLGAFVTIGNVVIPVLIARDYPPARGRLMTGVYTAAINVGTMTVTLTTAPLASVIGWRAAIAVWAVFGLAAIAVWTGAQGVRRALVPTPVPAEPEHEGGRTHVLRSPVTWLLALAFAGQAFSYYGVSAWLPTLLRDAGFEPEAAGGASSVFQVFGIAGALIVPLLVSRLGISGTIGVVALTWLAAPFGFVLAPQLWWLWGPISGFGQGGGLTVVFIAIVAAGGGSRATTARSGFVQGIGYAVGALGAVVVGGLHDVSGSWALSLAPVLVSIVAYGVLGMLGGRGIRRPTGQTGTIPTAR